MLPWKRNEDPYGKSKYYELVAEVDNRKYLICNGTTSPEDGDAVYTCRLAVAQSSSMTGGPATPPSEPVATVFGQ